MVLSIDGLLCSGFGRIPCSSLLPLRSNAFSAVLSNSCTLAQAKRCSCFPLLSDNCSFSMVMPSCLPTSCLRTNALSSWSCHHGSRSAAPPKLSAHLHQRFMLLCSSKALLVLPWFADDRCSRWVSMSWPSFHRSSEDISPSFSAGSPVAACVNVSLRSFHP